MPRKPSPKTATVGSAPSSPGENDWQGEDDLRTLGRAEDIRSDSTRMKRVLGAHRKQSRSLMKVGKVLKVPTAKPLKVGRAKSGR